MPHIFPSMFFDVKSFYVGPGGLKILELVQPRPATSTVGGHDAQQFNNKTVQCHNVCDDNYRVFGVLPFLPYKFSEIHATIIPILHPETNMYCGFMFCV